MPALAQVLIASVGWRSAFATLGATVLLIAIPVILLFLKDTPGRLDRLPDGEVVEQESSTVVSSPLGLTRKEAMHTGLFWGLCAAFFFVSASVLGCLIHLVPMLMDRGISIRNAALATSIIGGASLVGGLAAGLLLDRFLSSYVAAIFFCGSAVGILLLWIGQVNLLPYVAALLLGLGMGAEGEIIPYVVGRYFGLLAFGEIYSYALVSFTAGGVVGPLLFGVAYDRTGSYRFMLGILVLACAMAAGLMLWLRPYQNWDTEVRTVNHPIVLS
jgi:cyanate permease